MYTVYQFIQAYTKHTRTCTTLYNVNKFIQITQHKQHDTTHTTIYLLYSTIQQYTTMYNICTTTNTLQIIHRYKHIQHDSA